MATELEKRLVCALEALAGQQRPPTDAKATIYKEIEHIKEFGGEPNELTQFIQIVDTAIEDADEDSEDILWQAIFKTKVTGRAKDLLLNNTRTKWEEAKTLLKQHFRPTCSHRSITRRIENLKVSCIQDLCFKLENIISEINIFANFEENSKSAKDTLYCLVIAKIKDMAVGNLSREIRAKYCIHEIKNILYSYIGCDENISSEYVYQGKKSQNHKKHDIYKHSPNSHPNSHQILHQNPHFSNQHNHLGTGLGQPYQNPPNTSSSNFRRNIFNPSGQFRNAHQHPKPMDIDNISNRGTIEEINNIETVFLN